MAFAGVLLSVAAQAQVTVISRQPGRHAVAAPRNAAVTVGFSQPISAATAPNLKVYGPLLRGKRPGTVSGGGTAALTFTPNQAFAPGEVLSVSVPASLASTGGSAVTRQVFQFTAATGGGGRGFFGDTTVVGNTTNRDQVLGDLDNDGDLDLVTTGSLYGCRIFLNNGAGRFIFKTGVVAGQTPSGVALADVNQDGYLDMLVGDADNSTVAVCINDGTGDFIGSVTGAQNAPVGARPVSIAAGDVDGDGDLDFVTANADGNSATVRFNNGSLPLLYTTASTVAMGSGPTAVALADIDNDGDLDLLTANAGTSNNPLGTVSVSRNSGTGSFAAYTSIAVGLQPSELALADVDNDGDLDVLTANAGGASVSLRTNNGSGSFTGTTTLALPTGSTPSGLRTGDVDADGDLDLLVAQGDGGRVLTYLNAAGTFTVQARPLRLSRDATPATSLGVTLGDVDGDLDLDVITSDSHGKVLLSLNVGALAPLPVPTITSLTPNAGPVGATVAITGTALTAVTAVAFNGTPAPGFVLNGTGTGIDVAVPAGTSTGTVTVTTEEAGTATSATPFTIIVPVPVLVTGVTPARNASNVPRNSSIAATFSVPVTAATAGGLRVFGSRLRGRRPGVLTGEGTAALGFNPDQDFAPGERVSVSLPASLRASDGNQVSKQVVQFTAAVGGTGQMNFATASVLSITQPGEPVLGDLDNDGDVDLLTPNYYGGNVSLRRNDGAGAFSSFPDLVTGTTGVQNLALGDVDGDGDLDLLMTTVYAATVNVWLNNGSGAFSSAGSLALAQSIKQLALADVDADADLDLVLLTSQEVSVRLNNGTGTFSGSYGFGLYAGTNYSTPSSFSLGDVDADGDLDLVVAGVGSSQFFVKVELNNGAGQFTGAQEVACAASPGRVELGDLDGDGDLDLAVQNNLSYAARLSVRLNDGTGTFTGGGEVPLSGAGPVLADVDADGDLDIITHVGIGLNNGAGGFPTVVPVPSNSNYPAGIALGDLDGDLDLDLVTSQESNAVTVRLNRPAPAPAITAVSPGSGPVGSTVLVTGTNFIGTREVTLNGVAVPGYVVNSPTELVFTVPVGAATGPIAVTTPAGTATAATPFSVTLPIAVLSVSPARNATSAPRNAAVAVTFAQPISSASAANLQVVGFQLRGKRPGTVTGGGTSTLTFTPSQPFAPGETVHVGIPASLAGTASGNALRQVYQFTAATGGTGTGLFTATGVADVPIYYRSFGLTVGDLDNDGDQDLVTTDGSVRFNNGAGQYTNSTTNVALGGDPYGLALGDLNADGKLDLVSTNGQVRINAGNGTFTDLPNFSNLSFDTREVALGDLDGDGDLDVAFPKHSTDSLYIRFNNGTGGFPMQQRVAVGNRPTGVATGDVDNDGDLDLVVTNQGIFSPNTGSLSICFNNGLGMFTRVVQLPATTAQGGYPSRVALGDLDRDGDLDVVVSNGLVRFNDGTGTFTGTQQTSINGFVLVLGDVDADGDLDLVGPSSSGTTKLSLNNGQGVFSAAPDFDFSSSGADFALADVDGDGDLDALAATSSSNKVFVRLNHRIAPPVVASLAPTSGLPGAAIVISGTDLIGVTGVSFNGTPAPVFTVNSAFQITVTIPAGSTSGTVSVTNAAGTGTSLGSFTVLQPVAVASTSPTRNATVATSAPVTVTFSRAIPTNTAANLAVHSNQRGGWLTGTRTGAGSSSLTLQPARPFEPGERLSVTIPAFTDANQTRVVRQMYQFRAAVGGAGRGYFSAPTTFPLTEQTGLVIAGDVDNDGDQDLLSGFYHTVNVQRNNGAASFAAGTAVPIAPNPSTLVLGDVDNDGDLDLASASWSTDVVSIRLNDGAGNFSGTTNVSVGDAPWGMELADMDADGDLDLVTFNSGATACTTSVRFNDGTGTFTGTTDDFINNITNKMTSNVEIGDVDADGDLDLLVVVGASVHIRRNDGHGVLAATTPPIELPYGGGSTIYLGDVDGDGDLDVLAISASSTVGEASPISVCRNDGNGNFTKTDFLVADNTSSMVVHDVDADGDLDILVMGSWSDPAQLWLNNGQGVFSFLMDIPMGLHASSPQLADLDGDGDLDLISTNIYGPSTDVSVRLNAPTPPPVVASFSPASGPEGTTVVLTGSGFLGTTAVRFNGTTAPGFVINSPTQLTVRVPVGATTGRIAVTTPVAVATSAASFTVLPLVSSSSLQPGRNATSVARAAPINLGFGAPVTAATASNMRVFGNQLRGRRPGVVTGGGTASLSFNPDQDFAPGEQISVSLPYSMQTTNGGLVRRQVYQFTAATGGTGRGAFRTGTDVPVGRFAFSLAMGDLDNDGDLDILTPTEAGFNFSIGLLLNNGQARFTAGTSITPRSYTTVLQVALGDVDGDGDLDVLASSGNSSVSISLNNGNATFAPAFDFSITCNRFALGDMDEDGDLDLVASSYQTGIVSLGLNDGTGHFVAQPLTLPSPTALTVVLGDLDSDGDLDVLTCNDANGLRLFTNDGAGGLTAGAAPAVPGAVRGLALGDVDGDGDLDLAAGYNEATYPSWVTTFVNNGSGGFGPATPRVAVGNSVNQVLFGDMDHDSDLDLVVSNSSSDEVSIRLNNGLGSFSGAYNVPVHDNPTQMALGDLDGDGDLDFAATQATSGSTFADIRLNEGQVLATAAGASNASQVALYPNPAHGQFRVAVPAELRPVALLTPLRLYNSVGQQVLEQPLLFSPKGELTVDAAQLPAGIYTLHLPLKNGPVTYKVLVY